MIAGERLQGNAISPPLLSSSSFKRAFQLLVIISWMSLFHSFLLPNHLIELFQGLHRVVCLTCGLSHPLPRPPSIFPGIVSATTELIRWNSAVHYYRHKLSRYFKDSNKSLHCCTSVNETERGKENKLEEKNVVFTLLLRSDRCIYDALKGLRPLPFQVLCLRDKVEHSGRRVDRKSSQCLVILQIADVEHFFV